MAPFQRDSDCVKALRCRVSTQHRHFRVGEERRAPTAGMFSKTSEVMENTPVLRDLRSSSMQK